MRERDKAMAAICAQQTAGADVKRPLQIAMVEVAVGGKNRKADTYGSL